MPRWRFGSAYLTPAAQENDLRGPARHRRVDSAHGDQNTGLPTHGRPNSRRDALWRWTCVRNFATICESKVR